MNEMVEKVESLEIKNKSLHKMFNHQQDAIVLLTNEIKELRKGDKTPTKETPEADIDEEVIPEGDYLPAHTKYSAPNQPKTHTLQIK